MLLEPNIGIFISEFIILDEFWFGFIFVACFCLITIFFISFIYNVDNEEVKNKEEEECNEDVDGIKKNKSDYEAIIKKFIEEFVEKNKKELDLLDASIKKLFDEDEDTSISIIKKIIENFVEKNKKEYGEGYDSLKKVMEEEDNIIKSILELVNGQESMKRLHTQSVFEDITRGLICIIIIIWITWFDN